MKILGIETSCDETAAAVVEDGRYLLSNVVASSLALHEKTGGIVPEVAAREQLRFIIPVVDEALKEAGIKGEQLDAIAVTQGPGLVGSLLVGIEAGKALSWIWKKPLIPINHLLGHLYVTFLESESGDLPPEFPLLFLVVSGGHTQLVLFRSHTDLELLGETRDDAAGEAFDKVARLLNLGYPGGPAIEKTAINGDSQAYTLPHPLSTAGNLDFSFSGLKTAVLYLTKKEDFKFSEKEKKDLAASFQQVVVETLTGKTIEALRKTGVKTLVAGGGVLANKILRKELENATAEMGVKFYFPSVKLSTDNAAGIAAAAFYRNNPINIFDVSAQASMKL